MNDMLTFGFFAAAGIAGAVAFAMFHIYSGISDTLVNAKVGEVYNFDYLQPVEGDSERHLVKIIGTKVLTLEDIQRLNRRSNYRRYDGEFIRTKHLVTGQSADGTIRNFYAERAVNCRRPLLAPSLFKAGVAHLFF
jgi:hypothetical protein